jgi:hypothetical protein
MLTDMQADNIVTCDRFMVGAFKAIAERFMGFSGARER